jgi:hypothetical protein
MDLLGRVVLLREGASPTLMLTSIQIHHQAMQTYRMQLVAVAEIRMQVIMEAQHE